MSVPRRADVIARLSAAPARFDLFSALLRLESASPDKPRFGAAARPADEPVRVAQQVGLAFPPSAIGSVTAVAGGTDTAARIEQRVFGLTGPNGPLPVHLTEYAYERMLHHGDSTFARFLDLLTHRLALLFYRAWAQAQPAVGLMRPERAPVDRALACLFGNGAPQLRETDALGEHPRLHFAGRLARGARDAEGLGGWIRERFGVAVRIEQFRGHWMALPQRQRTRLGRRAESRLGQGAVLGGQVWDVQHRFGIVLGPLDWDQYRRFVPGARDLDELAAMVRQYVGLELAWDLRLLLRRDVAPPLRMARELQDSGAGRLGRTAWLGRRRRDADEMLIDGDWLLARENRRGNTRGHTRGEVHG